MSQETPGWFEINQSLLKDCCARSRVKVNSYNLTAHLSYLYGKIEELECRLNEQEQYQQEQNESL